MARVGGVSPGAGYFDERKKRTEAELRARGETYGSELQSLNVWVSHQDSRYGTSDIACMWY